MKKLEYTVLFNTPAFLGDAEQNGRWRTPPFNRVLKIVCTPPASYP